MRPKALVAGRSFFFNLLFVLLNLLGVGALLFGFHPSFAENSLWLKVLGFALFSFSVAGLILFRGRLMLHNFARVFVGGIFIVSGLVKANDPIGFSYKLEEYFEDGALAYRIKEWFGMPDFSFEYLIPMALGLAVFICVLEIVLGVLLIFRQKMKIVTGLVMAMMLFFTFLTWHTASCDNKAQFTDRDHYALNSPLGQLKVQQAKTDKNIKLISNSNQIVIEEIKTPQCVDDCGCFGDAMKGSLGRSLTPSESFWKDLILLYLSIWLLAGAFKKNTIPEENRTWYWLPALFLIGLLSWVFAWFFPVLFSFVAFFGTLWLLRNDKIKTNKYLPVVCLVTFLCGLVISYVLLYEPLKDYRPYAVGSNLKAKMNDGVAGKYENVLVYKNLRTGKIRKMDEVTYNESKIWKNKDWKFVQTISKEKVATKLPSITEQFSPFVSITDLSHFESEIEFVEK